MASLSIEKTSRIGWRAALRIAALALWLILCLGPFLVWRLLHLPSPWERVFMAGVTAIIGLRPRVKGRPVRRDVLYVANHVSWMDIPVLGGITGCAFIAKDDMDDWPVFGWLARCNRTVFVARSDRLAVDEQRRAARESLTRGWPLTLFPEGTTGDGRHLLRFHSSLFAAVEPPDEANAPSDFLIQPVAIDYGLQTPLIAWIDDEPLAPNALAILNRRHPLPVTLHFLDPIDPRSGNRKLWAADTREAIATALGQGHGTHMRIHP